MRRRRKVITENMNTNNDERHGVLFLMDDYHLFSFVLLKFVGFFIVYFTVSLFFSLLCV